MLFVAKAAETIKVDSVGKLATLLPDSVRFTIADLSVSGPLNGADLKLIQQIVNRTKAKEKNGECLVMSVDLSEATITEGKEGMKTKANELPNGLFSGAKALTTVILPQNITNISKSCFEDCKALVTMTIPETVTTIDNAAFKNCESLSAISIPGYVTTIGSEAFEDCKTLAVIEIPANIKEMGTQVF